MNIGLTPFFAPYNSVIPRVSRMKPIPKEGRIVLRLADASHISIGSRSLLLLILLLCLLPTCRKEQRLEKIEHPETGYPFPGVSEIAKFDFQGREWSDLPDFPVPRRSWDALLDALSPSQRDDMPVTWTALGVVRIVTTSGNEHWVSLYLVQGDQDEVGAFSAGPSEASYGDVSGW